ncbi:MAG TPA: tetratricopeptide repeat protein [Bryobacteraceae bacterium]|nr:tetratricopeptide repeat protein [Bryobacteraceae bacterium]
MTAAAAKQAYSRAETRRLLKITERQLKSWEHQKLLPASEIYGFRELLALRTILKLRASRLASPQIRRALTALREKLRDIHDPLSQLKIYADGKRIRVEIDGRAMEAESGQLLLNFDAVELKRLLEFRKPAALNADQIQRAAAEHWFQRGLELEQTGAPIAEVIEAYQKAVELDPTSAGALVNLGTIQFNARNWKEAERYYLEALKADPQYALAHFDLANLYDERGDRVQAQEHYQAALEISPSYADAHYNLALLYQGANQMMMALRHWTEYLKLDPSSHWSSIARRELSKLRKAAVVPGAGR